MRATAVTAARPRRLTAAVLPETAATQSFAVLSLKASRAAFYAALFALTFEQTRPYEISVSDFFFLLAGVTALPTLATSRLPFPSRSAAVPAGLMILLAGALSLLNADLSDPELFPSIAKLLVTFGILPFLVTIHARSVRSAALVFAAGITFNCGLVVLEAAGFGLREMLEINPVNEGELWGRHRGLTSHSNILGLAAGMASLVLLSEIIAERRFLRRALLGLAILGCAIALVLTTSRTPLLALPLIGVLLVAQGAVRPIKLIVAALALAIGLSAIVFFFPEQAERIAERSLATGEDNPGDTFRLESFEVAMSEIGEHPVLGWGAEKSGTAGMMYVRGAGKSLGTHNSPVQFWYAFGLLGLGGWLLMFGGTFRRLWQARQVAASRQYIDVHLCMLVLLFLAGNLHPFLFVRLFYVPVYLASAAAAWTLYESASLRGRRVRAVRAVRPAHV